MRERIILKTYEMAKRYGFRRLSMDELAKELGISKKTIYKYFADKQQLIEQVMQYQVDLDITLTNAAFNAVDDLRGKLDVIMGLIQEEQLPIWVVEELQQYFPLAYEISFRVKDHRRQLGAELMELGRQDNIFCHDIDYEIFGIALETALGVLLKPEYMRKRDKTCAEILEQIKKIFFYGVLSHRIARDE
jgi:AcrR family transcriptional regulator